jgi:hypothetical protein
VVVAATAMGALWGAGAYAVLWGYTSIVITPTFFRSVPGLIALLPARIVLWAIGVVERHVVHHPFSFATNHGWIGALSAVVGGAMVGLATFAIVALATRGRGEVDDAVLDA